jgi:ribonuclease BN (tRNA processing enzyme)
MPVTKLVRAAVVAMCCTSIASAADAQTKAAAPARKGKSQIVFLGTGSPRPTPEREGVAVAIVVNGTAYLVDAGTGVVRRAAAASRSIKGLEPPNLRFVFVTHLHSDHTIGLPDLITTPWIMGRTKPLELYGPPGISSMAKHIREAYKEDNAIRVKGLEREPESGSEVNAYDVKAGFVYSDSNVKVTTFGVKHGSWKNAFGYRFETPDRTIVFSGDASPSESIVEHCNGCDVLIHEVYTQLGFSKLPEARQQYFAAFHTSTKELAELAAKAKPKTLILYHQMYVGGPTDTEAVMLKEIRDRYKGRVVSAKDLDVF